MIKKSNPVNKNKQELLVELAKIQEKQLAKFEVSIPKLKQLKSQLIDLKVNSEDGVFSQLKLMYKLVSILHKLRENNVDSEKLEKFSKSLAENINRSQELTGRFKEFNEKLIDKLISEINITIVELQKKIKQWNIDKKKYKVSTK